MIDIYDIHPQMMADARTAVENLIAAGLTPREAYIAQNKSDDDGGLHFFLYVTRDGTAIETYNEIWHYVPAYLRLRTRLLMPWSPKRHGLGDDRYDLLARPAK